MALLVLAPPFYAGAQSFPGTNQPGAGSSFQFTVAAGTTNLSLLVTNSSTAFSYLYLKRGGTASLTSYDFVSRLDRANNAINLEPPELATGANYSLFVYTPANSVADAFVAVLTTNRVDARLASMPILKPVGFSATGTVVPGAAQYFQVDVPTNLPGWRVVLTCSGTTDADLYIQRGALPTQTSYLKRSTDRVVDTLFLDSPEATNATYSAFTNSATYYPSYYDWKQPGQILVVPPYLQSGTEYFVTVVGTNTQPFTLDSRQQPIVEFPFDSATNVAVAATDSGYVTFHVQVPTKQIAWQVDLLASSGDPAIAVRQATVPNEYLNTAMSATVNVPFETLTLVPPTLTDGSFYLTVWGLPPFTATLTNTRPVITPVDYSFIVTNNLPVSLDTWLVTSNAWTPNTSTNWPIGAQVSYNSDWTGFTSDASGASEQGHFFFASQGNPLQPGAYYVGVVNGNLSTAEMDYDLLARGIFPNGTVADVPFVGSNSVSGLATHRVVLVAGDGSHQRTRLGPGPGRGRG